MDPNSTQNPRPLLPADSEGTVGVGAGADPTGQIRCSARMPNRDEIQCDRPAGHEAERDHRATTGGQTSQWWWPEAATSAPEVTA